MRICAICGRKILKSMMQGLRIMSPQGTPTETCGMCYMITKINDNLILLTKEVQSGRPGKPGKKVDN